MGIGGSVTSEADMQAALATIVATWGAPDILINGAGGKDARAMTEVAPPCRAHRRS